MQKRSDYMIAIGLLQHVRECLLLGRPLKDPIEKSLVFLSQHAHSRTLQKVSKKIFAYQENLEKEERIQSGQQGGTNFTQRLLRRFL